MVLDPYIIQATSEIAAEKIASRFETLYPDWGSLEDVDLEDLEKWLGKLRKRPGLALSTGGTNSMRGAFTCCLLAELGIKLPKARRVRMGIAWAIIDSESGRKLIGPNAELEAELVKWRQVCWMP